MPTPLTVLTRFLGQKTFLDPHTPYGYNAPIVIDQATKDKVLPRLKRIEGQIRGIAKMIEDENYCINVINQVTAVRRALESTALILMKRHMETCLSEAIRAKQGDSKINEFLSSINHFVK